MTKEREGKEGNLWEAEAGTEQEREEEREEGQLDGEGMATGVGWKGAEEPPARKRRTRGAR